MKFWVTMCGIESITLIMMSAFIFDGIRHVNPPDGLPTLLGGMFVAVVGIIGYVLTIKAIKEIP